MKLLDKNIYYKGFDYTQIKRTNKVACYKQEQGGTFLGYEVFRIKKQKAGVMIRGGKEIPVEAKERFPKDEDFGYTAVSVKTLEQVDKWWDRLESLNRNNPLHPES